jgi:hypothetical protein
MSTTHFVADDITVEAGYDDADGKPMRDRERLAVHPDREHRVAPVQQRRGRRADGEPVDGARHQLVRAGLHPRLFEDVPERRADPSCVAQVMAADRVRDARERDVALDQPTRQELVVGECDLAVDHPVDPELPFLGGDRRDEERRVDPVEAVVRREER